MVLSEGNGKATADPDSGVMGTVVTLSAAVADETLKAAVEAQGYPVLGIE